MSALSILAFVLPLPLAFVLHDAEEIAVQGRWIRTHGAELSRRFPKFEPMIARLGALGTRGFSIAAAEELAVLLAVTAYVLVGGTGAAEVWGAVFLAFSLHLIVHAVQAAMVRGYVPGLATSLLLLPYAASCGACRKSSRSLWQAASPWPPTCGSRTAWGCYWQRAKAKMLLRPRRYCLNNAHYLRVSAFAYMKIANFARV